MEWRFIKSRLLFACAAMMLCNAFSTHQLYGQAGLRESLERLDKNGDGNLDPDEITPLARPYLERIAEARRLSLERPNAIDKWQEAARIHYALQNGVSGQRVRPQGESSIKPFGPLDEPMIPEFGLPEVKYPYTQADLRTADSVLRRLDSNKDGYIDRVEAQRGDWSHRDPFEMDLDHDDRLSRLELGQRFARRRLLSGDSDELRQQAKRIGSGIRPVDEKQQPSRNESRRSNSRSRLTASVMDRFDLNRNGRLEIEEASRLGIPHGRLDVDRDGELSGEELHAFFSELHDQAGEADALPAWFYERDENRDQQVAMSEFSSGWTEEEFAEFTTLDANGDGLLTTSEVMRSTMVTGGSYRSQEAEVLPPRKTIISEIDVNDDYLIGDLNVQLSITHSNASHLDVYLTGPDGQQIELFTDVGGDDDHFDQTVFDDQSRYPITKARPPFKGTFVPEAMLKRQPSLSHFNGKSIQGVWQLMVRGTRSDRFGMLHSWSLITKPQDELPGGIAAAPMNDGPRRPDKRTDLTPDRSKTEAKARATAEAVRISAALAKWKSELASRGMTKDQVREKVEARQAAYEKYKAHLEKKMLSAGDKDRDKTKLDKSYDKKSFKK